MSLSLRERAAVAAQHALPKQALTALAGKIADLKGGAFTTALVRWFIGQYGVDMRQAAESDPAAYASFNAFFTRALKPGMRPLAEAGLLCPVDGAVSQFGAIEGEQIFQAKGHHYSTIALLGGDVAAAAPYRQGHFATIYLAPKDYHRIHMPTGGRLLSMVHVPGALYSVNPLTARGVPGLFARNERVVCHFEGRTGPFVMVLVGATIVGSMETVWHGVVNPPRPGRVRAWRYEEERIELPRGAEMGRFRLGSTVVLLVPPGPLRFESTWAPGAAVRMGQAMAQRG